MTQRRRVAAALPLALIAAAPPPGDRAGNRLEPFAAATPAPAEGSDEAGQRSAVHCTVDRRWCAQLLRDGDGDDAGRWRVHVFQGMPAPGSISDRRPLVPGGQENGDSVAAFWPRIVRAADGSALIGVLVSRSTAFSGGGARASRLELVRAAPAAAELRSVLGLPYGAGLDIRACFSRRDERARRGACSDRYEFGGTLMLDPATAAGPPRFLFAARARTYPGRRSRDEDSGTAPPLRRSDLAWADDPACTYRRIFAWDEAARRYLPDRPLPDCAPYFDF